MFESILAFIAPIIQFAGSQWGGVGIAMAYVVLFIPVVTLLIELLEFIVGLTETKADDEAVSKVRAVWNKILPVLEVLPHANIPIAAGALKAVEYIKKGVSTVKGALAGWFGSKQ